MAELNNKELDEVTGGADQKEIYIGASDSKHYDNCPSCGQPRRMDRPCPNCGAN